MIRGGTICNSRASHANVTTNRTAEPNYVKLRRTDIRQAAVVLAQGFMDDPLYEHMLPERTTRLEVLIIFFRNYIAMLYEEADLYATSERLEAVALVFDSKRTGVSRISHARYLYRIACAIIKSIPMCRYISFHQFIRGLSTLNSMSSAWISELKEQDYIHLDMLVVQPQFRGQGFVSQLMRPLLSECDARGIPCTLETHNPSNISLYGHYGFEVVDTIPMPGNSVSQQYCMVYRPDK